MLVEDRRGTARPALIMAWGRGWAVSRSTPEPEEVPGGFFIEVGQGDQRTRHVLHTWTPESLRGTAERFDGPGHWIKIGGPARGLRGALPPHWDVPRVDHLMAAPLSDEVLPPSGRYRLESETDGELSVARILTPEGSTAASARIGMAGGYAVFDQVVTDDDHRRRGLGTSVMTALTERALERGAHTGVLVASDEGRALYETLGWTKICDFPAAVIPEPAED